MHTSTSPSSINPAFLHDIYYDRQQRNFWYHDKGLWTNVNKETLELFLNEQGISSKKGDSAYRELRPHLSAIDEQICRIIKNQQINFSMNVAGWPIGVHLMFGQRVLVQKAPELIVPVKGAYPFFEAFLVKACRNHPLQYDVLKSWLMLGLKRIYNFRYSYHQVLFMLGQASSGKSLFHHMITTLVGGRVANAEDWLKGDQMFNKDLHEAEHLSIEEPTIHDFRDRQKFANGIKTLAVVEAKRCRGLYAQAVSVCPIQLSSVSTNMEFDNLSVVPIMEAGVEDKFHAVLFPDGTMPLEGYEDLDLMDIQALVKSEAPAFLFHLFNEYKVPDTLLNRVLRGKRDCARMGMDAYHNPEITEMQEEMSKELSLYGALNRISDANTGSSVEGTAARICYHMASMTSDPDAVLLSKNPKHVGYLLRALHRKYPDRVRKVKKTNEGAVWRFVGSQEACN